MDQYKYLPRQKPISTTCWPGIGDFVVLSVDPVASVAHLDNIARRAARKLPVHTFLALTMTGYGLPLESKPFTSFRIALVRQGLPTALDPPWDTSDMCYPILPNVSHPTGRETIRPLHPLPFPNCYFETTTPFLSHLRCRVTTAPRDYTPVLPMPTSQLSRLSWLMSDEVMNYFKLRDSVARGQLDAIASIPLPPSPVSACHAPLPLSESRSSDIDEIIGAEADDEVSIIASDDDLSVNERKDADVNDNRSDAQLDLMLHFEDFINDTGDLHDPVVNVWYDLDMITEVTDPIHYIRVCDEIKKIIEEAEIRLGIKVVDLPAGASSTLPKSPETSRTSSARSVNLPSIAHSQARPKDADKRCAPRTRAIAAKAREWPSRMWHRLCRILIPCTYSGTAASQ
ncbi:unnamed protein product [Peniophora sp. CBMAI 1063]|nr:unnamed protein product [Peniophora sp. CBMAI 1063]